MVLELYGCPGCGKSTVTARTIDMLWEKGFRCVDYKQLFFNHHNNGFTRYISYIQAVCNLHYYTLTKKIFKTARIFKCRPRYAFYLTTMCQRIIQCEKASENTVILLDEGIIQFVTSLAHEKSLNDCGMIEPLTTQIKKEGIFLKPIDCVLPMEDNIVRLTGRGKRSRFLEAENEKELERLLQTKRENLSFVSTFFDPVLTLDMTQPVEENAGILYRMILSLMENK